MKKSNVPFIIMIIIVVASITFGTFLIIKRSRQGEQRAFDASKSYYDKQDYDKSAQYLSAYLQKYPKGKNIQEALYCLAISHQKRRDYTNAAQVWESVISGNIAARNQEAYYNLGICLENLNKFDLAIKSYGMAGDGPDANLAGKALSQQGMLYEQKREYDDAANAYRRIAEDFPSSESAREAGKKLGNLNLARLLAENSITYQVKSRDVIANIANKFNTTPGLIIKTNNIDPSKIRVGLSLKIPQARFTFDVGTEDKLAYLKYNGLIVKQYPIGVGKPETPTPLGDFKVILKEVNPTWYSPDGPIPPNDPRNQLGTRWLGFENAVTKGRGFGIHGIIESASIGEAKSSGCIRMYNEDVEELFDLLLIGADIHIAKQLQPGKWYKRKQ